MANQVIKKDSSKQPFDETKLQRSVEAAAQEAGLSKEKTTQLVGQVVPVAIDAANQKEEIATTELRDILLGELDEVEPSVAAAWRKYDESKT